MKLKKMIRVLNEIATLSIHLHINSEQILIKEKVVCEKKVLSNSIIVLPAKSFALSGRGAVKSPHRVI